MDTPQTLSVASSSRPLPPNSVADQEEEASLPDDLQTTSTTTNDEETVITFSIPDLDVLPHCDNQFL